MEHVHGVDIFDIYDIVYEPWWTKPWFLVMCLIFIAVITIFLTIYVMKYKKKTISFEQEILQQLDDLSLLINDVENAHNFYCSLTDILKKYLSYVFSISSSHTDEELLNVFSTRSDIPDFVSYEALQILQGINVIKFGKGRAVSEQMSKALESMKVIISKSIDVGLVK